MLWERWERSGAWGFQTSIMLLPPFPFRHPRKDSTSPPFSKKVEKENLGDVEWIVDFLQPPSLSPHDQNIQLPLKGVHDAHQFANIHVEFFDGFEVRYWSRQARYGLEENSKKEGIWKTNFAWQGCRLYFKLFLGEGGRRGRRGEGGGEGGSRGGVCGMMERKGKGEDQWNGMEWLFSNPK